MYGGRELKKTIKTTLRAMRRISMRLDELQIDRPSKAKLPKIFNLDLHISVINDLRVELAEREVNLKSWSISGSNTHTRKVFKISDPTDVITGATWKDLDQQLISDFGRRYKKFLSSCDGFVVTHTPVFAQLYEQFKKPTLVIASTRYEAPFSNIQECWNSLNHFILNEIKDERMLLSANNLGDVDYVKYFLGTIPDYTPSVCDYTKYTWRCGGHKRLVMCRDPNLVNHISKETNGSWESFREIMGSKYSWKDFDYVKEILVIPYNISTMSLFEFATAGIPVVVPSKKLLLQLILDFPTILDEISYFQVNNHDVTNLSPNNPNNYKSANFFSWWLDRADFYNPSLMPNVRVIDSLRDLSEDANVVPTGILSLRNENLIQNRSNLISKFLKML
jgi:hypothetical protein